MSANTQEAQSALSPIEHLQRTELFMQRLRAAGLNSVLEDIFADGESTVPMEELAAAARSIIKYRYATLRLDSYEPRRIFGIGIGYSDPLHAARSGDMMIDIVRKASRGMPYRVGRDWTPLVGDIEAKIIGQDLSDCWGRGAHTITIRVRTLRPAPNRKT